MAEAGFSLSVSVPAINAETVQQCGKDFGGGKEEEIRSKKTKGLPQVAPNKLKKSQGAPKDTTNKSEKSQGIQLYTIILNENTKGYRNESTIKSNQFNNEDTGTRLPPHLRSELSLGQWGLQ